MDSLQQAMLYQAMAQGGANMLNASAPSLDPRSGSLAYALGQGMQGGIQGTQTGIQQYNAIQETKAREEERKRKEALRLSLQKAMSPVQTTPLPLASSIQGFGNYTPQPIPADMGVQTSPLSQDQRLRDVMSQLAAAGEFESVQSLAAGLKAMKDEPKLQGIDPTHRVYKDGVLLETGVPKDGKATITSDEFQGAMAEIGIDPSEKSSYTTENIGKAAKYLREQKAKASATNIILGADPKTGNIIIGSSKGDISPTTIPTGALIDKTQTPLAPDQAAKVQLIQQALSYIPAIREGIFGIDPKNPKIDRTDILNIGLRTPFTKGRELSTMILDAVEAKLRLESGAAVPDSEVKRMAKRFIPQTADNDNTIRMKVDNLEKYLKETADTVTKGRPLLDRKPEVMPTGGDLITVTNPKTGKQETWDTKTQKRIK